jgi:Ca2+-binding EF-hand superfamily protein
VDRRDAFTDALCGLLLQDFAELASGLSVLCSKQPGSDPVSAAFHLFDIDGDGHVTRDEMALYMSSVFKVMFEADSTLARRLGVTADELALATATRCFEEADANGDGKLTLEVRRSVVP